MPATVTIDFTPTTSGLTTFDVYVLDAAGATLSPIDVPFSVSIYGTLQMTTTSLPNGTVNHNYSQNISATGGIPGTLYTYSLIAGALPANVNLSNAYSASALLSGDPSQAGTYNFTIQALDSSGNTISTAYTVVISPAIAITTTNLSNWTADAAGFSQTITATGGTTPNTFSWAFVAPSTSLPAGLSLNTSTGAITGTPTTAGTYDFTVTATDSVGASAQQFYSLTINPVVTLTTIPEDYWTYGLANFSLSVGAYASGGTGSLTYAVTGLPAGLGINSSTGAITGTPANSGTFSVGVTVTDTTYQSGDTAPGAIATGTFLLSIAAPISFSPGYTILPSWTSGIAYTPSGAPETITVSGGYANQLSFALSGSQPPGLSLVPVVGSNNSVTIAGTPTATGTFNFSIVATDNLGASTAQLYQITINAPISFNPTSLAQGLAGQSYSQTINVNNGTRAYQSITHHQPEWRRAGVDL